MNEIVLNQLDYTQSGRQHQLEQIRSSLSRHGYYLMNTGQVCADGELTAITQELGGYWQQIGVQQVMPVAQPQFIAQTEAAIPPHNECAYAAEPPNYLLLHCRENAVAGGRFYLVDGDQIISSLPQSTLALLFHMKFRMLMNPDFPTTVSLMRQRADSYHLQYTCIGHSDDWQSNQYYQPEPPLYQGCEQLIASLQEELRQEHWRHYHEWQAGDLLIFDNKRFLHGREQFSGFARQLDHIRIN